MMNNGTLGNITTETTSLNKLTYLTQTPMMTYASALNATLTPGAEYANFTTDWLQPNRFQQLVQSGTALGDIFLQNIKYQTASTSALKNEILTNIMFTYYGDNGEPSKSKQYWTELGAQNF